MIAFMEKCSLLERLTSECDIELRLSCIKSTTPPFALHSQSTQCLSHEIKLLQPLIFVSLNGSITEAF